MVTKRKQLSKFLKKRAIQFQEGQEKRRIASIEKSKKKVELLKARASVLKEQQKIERIKAGTRATKLKRFKAAGGTTSTLSSIQTPFGMEKKPMMKKRKKSKIRVKTSPPDFPGLF